MAAICANSPTRITAANSGRPQTASMQITISCGTVIMMQASRAAASASVAAVQADSGALPGAAVP